MSTRDWSEAYFFDEPSVHGREALSGLSSRPVSRIEAASAAYARAQAARADAIDTYRVPVAPLDRKVAAWVHDNEVAYEGRRPSPAWVRAAVEAHEAAQEAAQAAAIEAFLEADEAEAILGNLVKARAEYDAALAAEEAAQAAAESVYDDAIHSTGWVVCADRSTASKVAAKVGARKWDGKPETVKDRMVLTVSEALRITHPRNADRFVPETVVFHAPSSIAEIGFGPDMDLIHRRVNGS